MWTGTFCVLVPVRACALIASFSPRTALQSAALDTVLVTPFPYRLEDSTPRSQTSLEGAGSLRSSPTSNGFCFSLYPTRFLSFLHRC